INVHLPPLRERSGDVPALALHFARHYADENGKSVSKISDRALSLLVGHSWPGNVRELENVVERAVVLTDGDTIDVNHLPSELGSEAGGGTTPVVPGATMAELERHAILTTLEACGGSTSKAADVLGVSVRKIQYKLQEYGAAPKSQVPAVHARAAAGK